MLSILKFFLRIIPWWIWAILLVSVSPKCLSYAFGQFKMAKAYAAASERSAPSASSVIAFEPSRDVTPLGESVLRNLVPLMERPLPVSGDAGEWVYSLAADPTGQRFVAFVVEEQFEQELRARLGALAQGDAQIGGFFLAPHEERKLHDELEAVLQDLGIAQAQPIVMRPFLDGRVNGLLEARNKSIIVGVLSVLFGLSPVFLALTARRRAAAKLAAKETTARSEPKPAPAVMPSPWGGKAKQAEAQDAPPPRVGKGGSRKGDGFDDSPIQTTKRWFS